MHSEPSRVRGDQIIRDPCVNLLPGLVDVEGWIRPSTSAHSHLFLLDFTTEQALPSMFLISRRLPQTFHRRDSYL